MNPNNQTYNSKIFLIDFDDTCVISDFPNIIADNLGAVDTLKELTDNGHRLILFTCRNNITYDISEKESGGIIGGIKSGMYLNKAIQWFKKHDIPLYGIQKNPDQTYEHASPKPWFDYIIDDKALGIPLQSIFINGRLVEYVDWIELRNLLIKKQLI